MRAQQHVTAIMASLASASWAILVSASWAAAQCGEPAITSPCFPRVLPASPGVHEVLMDVSTAAGGFAPACGNNVGRIVWFEYTAAASGAVTFSTCHPNTTYDTVLQVWRGSGDCEFPIRLDGLCVDDSPDPACDNGCSFRGSTITFFAEAGQTYFFEVGAYNNNSAGCNLCLGVSLTICGGDSTPPVAAITSPGALGCSCNFEQIIGSAYDPDGTFAEYVLDYRPAAGGAWQTIETGTSPVNNGLVGTWNTSGLVQGYYYLRLTAVNACGLVNTDVQTAWVDTIFDNFDFRSPVVNAVVGGTVCLDGTVTDHACFEGYTAEYRPAGGGNFVPVEPGTPVYTTPVINDPFATWDTISLPDGSYELRVAGTTVCGNQASETRPVTVDNTAPVADIESPLPCAPVDGVVQVIGSALDDNLTSWVLQYAGGNSNGWVTIASGNSSVFEKVLANWDTSTLPACAYALRLRVSDAAVLNCNAAIHHVSEYVTLVDVGNTLCDINGDGEVNGIDIQPFVQCLLP